MTKEQFMKLLREHAQEFYQAGMVCEPMGTDRGHAIERELLAWFPAEPPAKPEESLRGIIEQILAEGGADQKSHAYLGEAMLARIRSALNRHAEPPANPPRRFRGNGPDCLGCGKTLPEHLTDYHFCPGLPEDDLRVNRPAEPT